jgi:hypothetical protein
MPSVFAQEVGHALRRKHAPACLAPGPDPLCAPGGPSPCYPNYKDGQYPSGSIGEFGFDVFSSDVYDPATYTDFMGYCRQRWVSPYTYLGLRAGMVERFGDPASESSRERVGDETLFLNFRIHRSGTVNVLPSFHLAKVAEPAAHDASSSFACELVDSDGNTLVYHRCAPGDPHQEGDGPYLDFHEALPWVAQASSIRFLRAGKVLDTHEIEADSPEVEIQTPAQSRKGVMTMEWTGRHPKKELTYTLRYSNDGGKTWRAVASSRKLLAHKVHPQTLPGGDRCLFQLVASSGIRTSVVETEPFQVPTKPRVASILSPTPGTEVPEGGEVLLRGGAYSPDYGLGDMEDVVWSSNIDGLLGRGFEVTATDLSRGTHTLSLTAPDGVDGTTTAEVSIRVTPDS